MKYQESSYRILIADARPENQSFLADLFCNMFEIMKASNAEEVMDALQNSGSGITLLLLDIRMPGPNGKNLLSLINSKNWTSTILSMAIYSKDISRSEINDAFKLGIEDCISMPFHPYVVYQRVINTILLYMIQQRLAIHWPGFWKQNPLVPEKEDRLRPTGKFSPAENLLKILDQERTKYQFFSSMSEEAQFEYAADSSVLTMSQWGASLLGLPEVIKRPFEDEKLLSIFGKNTLEQLKAIVLSTTPDQPVAQFDCKIRRDGFVRWSRIVCRATWSYDKPPVCVNVIGKVLDVHEEYCRLVDLEYMASHDTLTGLWNHAAAKRQISSIIKQHSAKHFALVIFDLDYFKNANDKYGHLFGDKVLKYVASILIQNIRTDDIAARVGGDEFLIFFKYHFNLEPVVQRIFDSLTGEYENFPISISMGVATTSSCGNDYNTLFRCADQALYSVKRTGRGRFSFYDDSLKDMFSVISPIDEMID